MMLYDVIYVPIMYYKPCFFAICQATERYPTGAPSCRSQRVLLALYPCCPGRSEGRAKSHLHLVRFRGVQRQKLVWTFFTPWALNRESGRSAVWQPMVVTKKKHMRKKNDFKKNACYFWSKSECVSLHICDTDQASAYLETAKSWIFNRNSSYTSTT